MSEIKLEEYCRWCPFVLILLASSIPFGIGMWIYTDNANWLWFCLPILLFLS